MFKLLFSLCMSRQSLTTTTVGVTMFTESLVAIAWHLSIFVSQVKAFHQVHCTHGVVYPTSS
jgi:hypothetical protein